MFLGVLNALLPELIHGGDSEALKAISAAPEFNIDGLPKVFPRSFRKASDGAMEELSASSSR